METDSVNRINDFGAVLLRPMTFECEFTFLYIRVQVKVFDGHTAFNRAHHKTILIWKDANATRLIFQ